MIIVIIIIIPWNRVLPEKVPGPQLSQIFSAFYGTRKFITTFKTARHLSLSRTRSIHFVAASHFLKIYFNIIVTFRPRFSKWSLSLRSLHKKNVYAPLMNPIYATCPTNPIHLITPIIQGVS